MITTICNSVSAQAPAVALNQENQNFESFSVETCMHISSYEQLMRTTSYNLLKDCTLDLKSIPTSPSRHFNTSLSKVIDSAERAVSRGKAASLPTTCEIPTQLQLEEDLNWSSRRAAVRMPMPSKQSPLPNQSSWHFLDDGARESLTDVWEKAIEKKNSSLMISFLRKQLLKY